MTVITTQCAHCHQALQVSESDSIYRRDGHLYDIYHGTCFEKKDQSND